MGEQETAEEAEKFGKVERCTIREVRGAPEAEAVRVFVEYARSEDAAAALAKLNCRSFGGREVKASCFDEEMYRKGELVPVVDTPAALVQEDATPPEPVASRSDLILL